MDILSLFVVVPIITILALVFAKELKQSRVIAASGMLVQFLMSLNLIYAYFKEKQFNAKVIYLLDRDFHPQNLKRFDALKEMLTEQKVEVLTLSSDQASKKVRIMDLIFLSDWISFYASVLRGFDPSEIDFIHRMKKRLT